jgi:uncharacterized protein YidB (DUF937 family)
MSLLDSLGSFSSLLSQFQEGQAPSLLTGALQKTDMGGLDGIVATLQQGGLGAEVQSWLGTGENLPITADQLRAVLSNEQVQQIADHFGIPVDGALSLLAEHLPTAVDQASPSGEIPGAA